MWTVYVNVRITRRKAFVIVQDENEETKWTGTNPYRAFDFCMANEQYTLWLDDGEGRMRIMLGRDMG